MELVSKKKSNYNIKSYGLIINQSHDLGLIFTKTFIFTKILQSN